MIYEFIYSINILVSVLGFLSCFYILIDNTLNKQTARFVISTCLAGFIWFGLLYSSLLQIYQISTIEIIWKILFMHVILVWIKNNYLNINGVTSYVRI